MSKIVPLNTQEKVKHKNYRFLVIIGIVVTLLLVILYQLFKIENISITGNIYYSNEEILEMLDINHNFNSIRYRCFGVKKEWHNYPYIESIQIENTTLKEIHIKVVEKTVVGYIPYMGKYISIDKDGTVIGYGDVKAEGIPIIKGLYFQNFIIRDKLCIDNDDVFDAIYKIYRLIHKHQLPIDTVHFHMNAMDRIDLYFGEIEIHIGGVEDIYEKFAVLSEILLTMDKNQKGEMNLSNINEKIVFKKKE